MPGLTYRQSRHAPMARQWQGAIFITTIIINNIGVEKLFFVISINIKPLFFFYRKTYVSGK